MRNLARKGLNYFIVFTVILWNIGTPAFAVDIEGLDKTTDSKITVCHVVPATPGHAGKTETIEISESAWPTHETHGDVEGTCPPPPPPPPETYCDTADVVIDTTLKVVGDGCYDGTGPWLPIDTEIVPMTLAGNYEVYAEVERSDPGVQLAETFTLDVEGTTGPELPDNEEAQNVIEQYAGDFYFNTGNNLVTMTTTAQCPPDETPNSVKVLKLCMNVIEEEEECSLQDNLLVNSSFEAPEVTDPALWQKMSPVLGWDIEKVSDSSATTLELHRAWSGNVAAEGLQYAELDGDHSTRIYQDVATEEGAEYKLFWSFAPRHNITAEQNHLSVEVGGSQVETNGPATGSAPLAQGDWTKSDYVFIADGTNTEIALKDIGPSDSFGTFVDDVRLCKISDPEVDPYCGDGTVNQTWEQCDDGNLENGDGCDAQCQIEIPDEPYLTVKAHKIVCDAEEYLPNWGDGSGPGTITATTATDYVAQNEHCWLADNWSFQWGIGVPVMPGDHIGSATSGAWMDFNSVSNGVVPAQAEIFRNDGTIKIRENLQEGYIPFSYTPGTGQTPPGDSYSAEIYCHNDVLNYDNYDYINSPQLDYTYYCVAFNAETEPQYDPYCGDGIVNQKWEQCDPGLTTLDKTEGGGGQIVGCSQQCQYVVPPQECSDLTLAKISVDDFRNWNGGDMTSDLFLGSESYMIPHDVWFAVYWNGSYFLDADLSNYEDVPGLAVQRLEDSLRVVMHGTGSDGEKEHVSGDIEFWNATVGTLESDNSNAYPNSNSLENGFDGTGVGFYNAGNDEVWVADGKSNYWLTTTTADDGYYTNWGIIEDCDGPSICGVKFEDVDKDGRQGEIEQNLADWTINLYEKSSCQEGDEWADRVVEYNPGPNVPTERSNPNKALGVAENNDTMNFVSLGVGGELILEFDNLIENNAGDDIQVFETSYGNPSCAAYPEYVHVYASQDGTNWTSLGSGCQEGDPSFDLGVLPWAKYVKLVDESSGTPDGFDVDGVKAINCLNVDEEPVATEVTTENGYCFDDVEPGYYMVCEEMQEGWTNSTPLCQQVLIQGEESVSKEQSQTVNVDFGNYEETQSIPYAPWCSALLGIVTGAIQTQTYNEVADLYNGDQLQVINLSDIAVMAQLYAEGNNEECYKQFEDPEDDFHWTCDNIEEVDWCGGLKQGVKDSYSNPDNYFFVFDLWNDHGDGTYGDGVMNLSDIAVMASYLAEPVDQYQCYDHYPFFDCTPNTPPVITLIGDDPVYIYQWETYNDDGATADDAEDGDITGDIVTNDSVDTSNPGIYIVTYNVSDSKGAAAPEVTRTVIVQSQGGGDPICGNEILEEGEDCDGSAPEGYQCTDQCELIQIPPPPPPPPGCVGSCGGGGDIWPPTISNVGEGPQCELTTVTWKTSEDSISWVVYGTDENNLDQEYKSTEKFEEHSIVLPGLVSGTTYYYMVKAQNEHGISNNDNHSFTTPSSESCGEVLGEKIVDEEPAPISCDFFRPSGSIGTDADTEDVFAYPDGSLIRYECDHTMGVFAIREQMKWHVPTWQYLHDHYFGKRIYNISWGVFNGYPDYNEDSGLVAGVKVYSDGTLLRGSDKKVYIIESGHKRHIISLEELKKYTGKEIVNVSDDVLNQY